MNKKDNYSFSVGMSVVKDGYKIVVKNDGKQDIFVSIPKGTQGGFVKRYFYFFLVDISFSYSKSFQCILNDRFRFIIIFRLNGEFSVAVRKCNFGHMFETFVNSGRRKTLVGPQEEFTKVSRTEELLDALPLFFAFQNLQKFRERAQNLQPVVKTTLKRFCIYLKRVEELY